MGRTAKNWGMMTTGGVQEGGGRWDVGALTRPEHECLPGPEEAALDRTGVLQCLAHGRKAVAAPHAALTPANTNTHACPGWVGPATQALCQHCQAPGSWAGCCAPVPTGKLVPSLLCTSLLCPQYISPSPTHCCHGAMDTATQLCSHHLQAPCSQPPGSSSGHTHIQSALTEHLLSHL